MMNGSSTFEGYVPEIDATVVTRILDAGATIVGKAANEDYCYSGGSHTNARYPVDNPHRPGFTAGGSSSGSAALVGGGVVDMAIGTDQGGSIRQPASCCGVVGMKATFGLVPCTGNLGAGRSGSSGPASCSRKLAWRPTLPPGCLVNCQAGSASASTSAARSATFP